jgi:hypothetical protein
MTKNKTKKTNKIVKMDVVEEPIEEIVVVPDKNKELIIGETYKITGGKYKKFKQCVLQKINKTYSDCELPLKEFNADDKCLNQSVKIKNLYLLPMKVNTIDMPDADQLFVVDNLDTFLNENPEMNKKFEKLAIDEKPNIISKVEEPTPADINKEKDETIIKLNNDNVFLLKEIENLKQDLLSAIDMSKTNREKELENTIISVIMAHYN